MQVLPPVQLARSRVRGAAVREGRAPARPPARRAMDPRRPRPRQARPSRARRAMDPRRLGRDKRDPPVRRIRRVTMWCRGRGRRPRRPVRPMAFPCTCRAALGRDKRDPPVPGAQWTRAALGRDKRDPPVRRIRRVTMWCRGRGRRPRRPARPMASPCTCRAAVGRPAPGLPVSAQKVFLVQCPSLSGGLFCPCNVPFSLPVSPWRPVPPAASPIRSTYT